MKCNISYLYIILDIYSLYLLAICTMHCNIRICYSVYYYYIVIVMVKFMILTNCIHNFIFFNRYILSYSSTFVKRHVALSNISKKFGYGTYQLLYTIYSSVFTNYHHARFQTHPPPLPFLVCPLLEILCKIHPLKGTQTLCYCTHSRAKGAFLMCHDIPKLNGRTACKQLT